MNRTFGSVIAKRRRELRYTLRAVASRIYKEDGLPISSQYLSDLERARRNPPAHFIIEQFSTLLKIDPDYLYFCAGKYPPDLKKIKHDMKSVATAFRAFRIALKRSRNV